MPLETELKTYEEKKAELSAENEGKYVLIHGDSVIDVFGTYEDAIKEGYGKFQLEPFLVRQIHSIEQVQFISHGQVCLTSPAR